MKPPSKWDLDCLRALIADLKCHALYVGRYHPPYTPKRYDSRREQHGAPERLSKARLGYWTGEPGPAEPIPYRNISYERTIRQVTALERILAWEQGWKDCPSTPQGRRKTE